ncbi:MAG: alpha/beta hydrolase-fold protein, partial [Candidatus Aminicenantes bacterium]|nr:alpha/beta hydrolase-fold protein [Candidatus Aminicenantes bacterium]
MRRPTKFFLSVLLLFLVLIFFPGHIIPAGSASSISAQQDGDDVVIGTYRTIRSDILDEERLLLIHLPEDYDQTGLSYPVLYLLYGQDVDNYFAEAMIVSEKLGGTGEMPPMIIVGVANTNRYRDNLPVSIRGREDTGGAANFLQFFEKELFPFIEKKYRTKPFRLLAGPQAGAVFGLHALITRPDLFHAVISENPFMNPENAEVLFPKAKEF